MPYDILTLNFRSFSTEIFVCEILLFQIKVIYFILDFVYFNFTTLECGLEKQTTEFEHER